MTDIAISVGSALGRFVWYVISEVFAVLVWLVVWMGFSVFLLFWLLPEPQRAPTILYDVSAPQSVIANAARNYQPMR